MLDSLLEQRGQVRTLQPKEKEDARRSKKKNVIKYNVYINIYIYVCICHSVFIINEVPLLKINKSIGFTICLQFLYYYSIIILIIQYLD